MSYSTVFHRKGQMFIVMHGMIVHGLGGRQVISCNLGIHTLARPYFADYSSF